MGQALADAIGFKEAILTVQQSAEGVLQQVWLLPICICCFANGHMIRLTT
jgi:hypothetical protein